jgi:cholesterol transport system auxiliary component
MGCAGGGGKAPATYDLIAPRAFAGSVKKAPWQLVVYEPVAVHTLETNRLAVRPQPDQVSYYKGIAWTDRLPRLVQARLIESFQNSGAVKAVSNTYGQYALASELRAFQIDVTTGRAAAEVDIFAKLIQLNTGKVIATKGFNARVPARSDAPEDAFAALNQAFTQVVQDITTWIAARRG